MQDSAQQTNKYGHQVSFSDAVRVWWRIALLSFGGPAGQIAVMHRILVDEKRWVSESRCHSRPSARSSNNLSLKEPAINVELTLCAGDFVAKDQGALG